MAKKDKSKKDSGGKAAKAATAPRAPKAAKAPKAPKAPKASKSPKSRKSADGLRVAGKKMAELASNPVVAEVVAATLVAAAAALRSPDKARALAESARNDLSSLGKGAAAKNNPFWQLALDVAQKSVDTLGRDGGGKKRSKSKK
jgi:hypothetical protein